MYKDESLSTVVMTASSDASGKAVFKNLDLGDVWVKETKAPTGHMLGDTVWNFFVDDGMRFLGEVPASDFINGTDLGNQIGLSGGISMSDNVNNPWLKFEYQGKEVYVAKEPYRHSISWDSIAKAGAALPEGVANVSGVDYSQGKTVSINGQDYVVRLIKAYNHDIPWNHADTWSHSNNPNTPLAKASYGSEWNRLILPIVANGRSGITTHGHVGSSMVQFANYDWFSGSGGLGGAANSSGVGTGSSYGAYTWGQEYAYNGSASRALRGYTTTSTGAAFSYISSSSYTNSYYGWRPILIPSTNH